jgi:hypothetical protein
MTSLSSASLRPLSLARARWPRSCSVLPFVMSATTLIRLRSRLDSFVRSQTSPKRTSSVTETSFGAKSPIAFCAGGHGLRVGHVSFSFMIRNAAGA